jgi:hypothetical protein
MWGLPVLSVALLAAVPVCSSPSPNQTAEAFYQRNIFYAGGEYEFSSTSKGTILVNQLYVEQITPMGGKKQKYPIVFVHGGGVSGTVNVPGKFWVLLCTDHPPSNGSTSLMETEAGRRICSKRGMRSTS